MESRFRVRCLGLLGASVAAIVLAACGGDSTQESTTTTATSTTAPASTTTAPSSTTTTTTASSTTTVPSETTEAAADFDVGVDAHTEWGEVFDALTTTEQECIRDSFEGDLLESVLGRPVMSESDAPEAWEVSMFSCLAPQTARAVFLALLVAGMEEDGVFRTDAEAQSCLDEWVAGIDVVATMVALSADDAETAGEVTAAFMSCNPDLFISLMLEETGMTLEDLSEEEASCFREWAASTDWATLSTGPTGEPSAATLLVSLLDCAPDALLRHPGGWRWNYAIERAIPVEIGVVTRGELDYEDRALFALEATEGGLYDVGVTLDDYLLDIYDADGTSLTSGEYGSDTAPVIWYAPATGTYYVRLTSLETAEYTLTITVSDIVDDHSNTTANATLVEIGAATQGELEYENDIDYFTFEATEGQYYDLDVTHGTLELAIIYVYEEEAGSLANGLDFRDSAEPPLNWHAPATGTYYVGIFSFDRGTYTLTISTALSDLIVDDYPNSTANATPVEIGMATQGELEYQGDIDYFTFEATEGQQYELDVTLGTLGDSVLDLSDADGNWLDLLDIRTYDGSSASRLIWTAPTTGTYYVDVFSIAEGAASTGTYTLTITISDIEDDHPNTTANATLVQVGMATQGELEYNGDKDFFTFEATEGEYYQLDVTLGTLQRSSLDLLDADGAGPIAGDRDYSDSTASRLIWYAPSTDPYHVRVSSFDSGTGTSTGTYTLTIAISDIVDDHPNSRANATPVAIGTTQAELEYPSDRDYFTFEATEGESYELNVTLGTLQTSRLDLIDADGNWLGGSDNYSDSTASRLIWTAPATGPYHVPVHSYGHSTGTYTLTIAISDIVDDHPNSRANATPVEVGITTQGELEYASDRDYFTFEATEGESYELYVTLETLQRSRFDLYDAYGHVLGGTDDYRDSTASPLIWTAPATGPYHVQVHSFGASTGTYTLTIAPS